MYPFLILIGTVSGMVVTSSIGIFVGSKVGDKIPELMIKILSGSIFMLFGVLKLANNTPDKWIQVYTVIPFIIVAVLFYYTAQKQTIITEKTTTYAHEITVEGIQWSWQFGYPEAGPKAVVTGTPEQTPTLVVPLGERVRYTLTANDVVHGFWIPAFMIQMQNLPGVTNHLEFTANKLGEFPGRCNILCGRNHSQMLFTVKVVTPAEYDAYLETIKGGQA